MRHIVEPINNQNMEKLLPSLKVYLESLYGAWNNRRFFNCLNNYCMFVGYPRSGHTLVGALLDAHPNMIVATELNALEFLERKYSRQQIYYLLIQNSQKHTVAGREWTGYSYKVPNQWQGRFQTLKVIGDKKGGASTRKFRTNPEILKLLQKRINIPIKFIHVIRNPYDNISTMYRRKSLHFTGLIRDSLDLESYVHGYFNLCETIDWLRKKIPAEDWFDIKHESLIENPQRVLQKLCNFLQVEAKNDYLESCASIVFKSPKKTRYNAPWTDKLIDLVSDKINQFSFLIGYSYHDK